MTPANGEVENETNDGPRDVVGRIRGRDGTETAEHYGEVDVLDNRVGPLQVNKVAD